MAQATSWVNHLAANPNTQYPNQGYPKEITDEFGADLVQVLGPKINRIPYDQLSQADIESCIEEFCNRACAKLARDLEDDYEHLTSVESFIESCECNEITFDIETEEEKEHEVHCEN